MLPDDFRCNTASGGMRWYWRYLPKAKRSNAQCDFGGVFDVRQTVCRIDIGARQEKLTSMLDGLLYIKDATQNSLCN
jgi:hypothetical protein